MIRQPTIPPAGVFWTPIIGVAFPDRAARRLAARPARELAWIAAGWWLLLALAIALVQLALLGEGLTIALRPALHGSPLAQVGPGILATLFGLALSTAALLAGGQLAAMHTPQVYAQGPILPAVRLAFAGVLACVGWLCLLTLAIGIAASADPLWERGVPHDARVVIAGFPALWLVLAWIDRAVAAIAADQPAAELGPLCEGCGYSLQHVGTDGRCTECGLSAAVSLDFRLRRAGVAWERDAGGRSVVESWVSTAVDVLSAPRAFYQRLRFRATPGSVHRRFAYGTGLFTLALTYGGLCTIGWLLGTLDADVVFLLFPFLTVLMTLGAYLAHLHMLAIAGWVWMLRGDLPDFGHFRRLAAYETAYAPLFVLFVLAFALDAATGGRWLIGLTRLIPTVQVFGIGEPLTLLLGVLLLLVIWVVRLLRVRDVVRWANH